MQFGDVVALLIAVGFPSLVIMVMANRFFRLRERKLEVEAMAAAERAAQYAASNTQLEARMRTLEQIVTDKSFDTATKIEALRHLEDRVQ